MRILPGIHQVYVCFLSSHLNMLFTQCISFCVITLKERMMFPTLLCSSDPPSHTRSHTYKRYQADTCFSGNVTALVYRSISLWALQREQIKMWLLVNGVAMYVTKKGRMKTFTVCLNTYEQIEFIIYYKVIRY